MAKKSDDAAERPSFWRRAGRRAAGSVVSLGLIATVFAGSLAAVETLKERAASVAKPKPTPPLSVATIRLKREAGYAAIERFAGRLEPARATNVAFERAGRVEEVLVDEGARVKKDQILARLDTAKLIAERARLDAEETRLKAELTLARRTRDRQNRLKRRGFASGQAADEAVSREAALVARLSALDAQKRALDVDITRSVLKAPFDGYIASRGVDPGAYIAPGASIVRLLEIDKPQARIGLPPERARALDPSKTYEITFGEEKLVARVAARRPDLSTSTRTVAVLFDLEAPTSGARLVFGDVVRLALTRRFAEPGAWLPLSALQEGVKGLWTVFVASPYAENGARGFRLTQEAVEVIHVAGGRAYVRTALAEGARVVVSGVTRIASGQIVTPIDASGRVAGAGEADE